MVTIDLTTPPPPAASFLDGLPRRLALTLPELRLAAESAGGAPLPFDLGQPDRASGGLTDRLGAGLGSADDTAYAAALSTLHDPAESMRRRGLVVDGRTEPGLVGAIGLLATPDLALDVDVSCGGTQVKAWHRHAGGAVATLSTCDGIVFELAWFPVGLWSEELARVTALPEDLPVRGSSVPPQLDAPYSLLDAAGEALRSGRSDLVGVLVSHHAPVLAGGASLAEAEAAAAISAVHAECRGRLRILAAQVTDRATTTVGVVSWTLLADGWHSLSPRVAEDGPRVGVAAVRPDDLATELAPVLAQVVTA